MYQSYLLNKSYILNKYNNVNVYKNFPKFNFESLNGVKEDTTE